MRPSYHHLAQVNIARMTAPLDSPAMQDFTSQLPVVNAIADRSKGFVWRLAGPEGDATAFRVYQDPFILFNLSVWESIEALKAFTYNGSHLDVFRNRGKWFERPSQVPMAMWWIPAGHLPSVEEGAARLQYRREHGDTAAAFSFAQSFAKPEEPSADPVAPAVNLDQRLFVTASNSPNGDADSSTRFRYRQSGVRVWATYDGGRIRFGSLVAVGDASGRLDMRYHHVAADGAFRTGACLSTPQQLADGRLRLLEDWRWTNGDRSAGHSMLEEIVEHAV